MEGFQRKTGGSRELLAKEKRIILRTSFWSEGITRALSYR